MIPLVCLHGFTGDPSVWRPVLARLSRRAGRPEEAVCPALCGHRPGRDDRAIASFDAEVDRLAARLDAGGVGRAVLVGYSLGARLALGLLVRHAARFAAAVLIGARPGPPPDGAVRAARAAADEELAALLEREGIEAFVDRWQALPIFASQATVAPSRLAVQRRRRLAHDPAALAHALRVLSLARMPDYRPALGTLPMPVRLLAGARDSRFVAAAEAMARRLERATVTVVPEAGHNLILEAPHAVAAAVSEELERCQHKELQQPLRT